MVTDTGWTTSNQTTNAFERVNKKLLTIGPSVHSTYPTNMNIHPAQDPVAVEHRRLAIQVAVAVSLVVTLLTSVVITVGLVDQYRHNQPLSVMNALRELQPARTGWAP